MVGITHVGIQYLHCGQDTATFSYQCTFLSCRLQSQVLTVETAGAFGINLNSEYFPERPMPRKRDLYAPGANPENPKESMLWHLASPGVIRCEMLNQEREADG